VYISLLTQSLKEIRHSYLASQYFVHIHLQHEPWKPKCMHHNSIMLSQRLCCLNTICCTIQICKISKQLSSNATTLLVTVH